MEQSPMAYVQLTLLLSAFVVMFSAAQLIYHTQNECYSKDSENFYKVLSELRRDIDELKHSIKQLQNREQGLVVVEMRPMILYARFDNTSELLCSIHYRGYKWSAVNIFQKNTSGSFSVLNVTRDGKVESKNDRINGSMTVSDDIINVSLSFDLHVSRVTGVCELNQTYSCNIQLVDTSNSTKTAYSTLILETPPLNLTVETMPGEYAYYGSMNETINCTATMNPNTTVLSLIGKRFIFMNDYVFAERKNVQTFLDSENKIGCYTYVQTVFSNLGHFLRNYNFVGCLANDTVSGQSSITEFKSVNVIYIDN